jgi:hypothetical protein
MLTSALLDQPQENLQRLIRTWHLTARFKLLTKLPQSKPVVMTTATVPTETRDALFSLQMYKKHITLYKVPVQSEAIRKLKQIIKQRYSCLCASHKGIQWSGDMNPAILQLGTKWKRVGRFTSGERVPGTLWAPHVGWAL